MWKSTILHRAVLFMALAVWTWLLLKPNPVPTFVAESLLEDVKFILGKCLHFAVFAALAWYATFRVSKKYWAGIWLACVAYAILTELGQYYGSLYFDTHRGGSIRDVLIDSLGVLAGAFVRRRWN